MADDFGPWDPLTVDEAVAIFSDAPFRWWVSGGHALELHLGASWRDHGDFDVAICRVDAPTAYVWLGGDWDLHRAAGGRLVAWDGSPLEGGQAANNVWARRRPGARWRVDLTMGAGSPTEWVYRRDPSLRLLWDDAVLHTDDGIPYLAPELQLLFKAKHNRPKDTMDAERVVPKLDGHQRAFLVARLPVDHPWQRLAEA